MKDAGPAMAWYGLMANAGIVALLAAFIVPDAIATRLRGNRVWLFPMGAMAACVFLRRHFATKEVRDWVWGTPAIASPATGARATPPNRSCP